MTEKLQINEQITVGGQPSEEELHELAEKGYRTVVNLRTQGEENQTLSPADENSRVHELGMDYVHFPVAREQMSTELEDEFRQRLSSLEKPVFVHCGTGRRAGAFVMMDQAIHEGWSGEDTLKKADDMGFECDVPAIKDFVKTYVDSRQS